MPHDKQIVQSTKIQKYVNINIHFLKDDLCSCDQHRVGLLVHRCAVQLLLAQDPLSCHFLTSTYNLVDSTI